MKIVLNKAYGGFALSEEALRYLGFHVDDAIMPFYHCPEAMDMKRNDPRLIEVVEKLGKSAGDSCSKLVIEDVPAGYAYKIREYDGYEHIELLDINGWEVVT